MTFSGILSDTRATARKILVIDDQADVREALRLLLKSAGYAADTADSPKEALAAVAYNDHDLIVMDMNFAWDTTSGEEGLQLLDRLRAQRCDVPVIAMTGWSTVELAVQAMQRGACDFVPKPWDNRQFLSTIDKHLDGPGDTAPRRDPDLAIARKVQRKLLPPPHFTACGLECECASLPMGEIGGDLYDLFQIDSGTLAFLLGDVCGKGIGAALLVANLQATIRGQQELARSPSRLMGRVNELFFQSTRPEHFASLFYGTCESATRTVRYVNCGHPSPVLLRANGASELLDPTGTVLGAFIGSMFEEQKVEMSAGDRLILFSDGFSEAGMDDSGSDVSLPRIKALGARHTVGLAGLLAAGAASLGEQTDDITVMTVRVQDV